MYLILRGPLLILFWCPCLVDLCLRKQSIGGKKNAPVSTAWDTSRYKRELFVDEKGNHCACATENDDYPNDYYFVVFSKTEPNNTYGVCGATLIASNLLVTSNKCFTYANQRLYPYETWKSAKGKRHTAPLTDTFVVQHYAMYAPNRELYSYAVKEIILSTGYALHPQGAKDFPDEDIALIVLEKNLFIKGYYSACLPRQNSKVAPGNIYYRHALYSGAGGLARDDPTVEYRIVPDLVTLKATDCEKEIRTGFPSKNEIICARFRHPGPLREGGALIMPDKNKREFLVGIGGKVGYTQKDANFNYAYFTNVLHFTQYIEKHAQRTKSLWCETPEFDLNMPLVTNQIKSKPLEWESSYKPPARDESLDCAHCVVHGTNVAPTPDDVRPADKIYAYAIKHDDGKDPLQKRIPIGKIVVHPDYFTMFSQTTIHSDLALLFTEQPITWFLRGSTVAQTGIRPICLQKFGEVLDLVGKMALNTGWGVSNLNTGETSPVLKKIELPIQPLEKCAKAAPTVIHEYVICGGTLNALRALQSTQQGDSGGPLSIPVGDDKLWTEIGVVSFGSNLPKLLANGTVDYGPYPVFFVNLQKFIGFIEYYSDQVKAKWCRSRKS